MILAVFRLGGEEVEVIIKEGNLFFRDLSTGSMTTIEGLRLNKSGVIKQFPDLDNNESWKKEAIERFKIHINKMKKEKDKINYIREELEMHGYEPLFMQRAGFRPERFT